MIDPWIVDSWREAFAALGLRLPSNSTDSGDGLGLVALTAILLLMLGLRGVRHLPTPARLVAMVLLGGVMLLPALGYAVDRFGGDIAATAARVHVALVSPVFSTGRGVIARSAVARPSRMAEAAAAIQPKKLGPAFEITGVAPASGEVAPASSAVSSKSVAAPEPTTIQIVPAAPDPPRAADTTIGTIKRLAALIARKLPVPHPRALDDADQITVLFGTDRVLDAPTGTPESSLEQSERHLTVGRATVTFFQTGQRVVSAIQQLDQNGLHEQGLVRIARSQRYSHQALIVVHGFNTSFEGALAGAGQVAHDLVFDGAVYAYSWPSTASPVRYTADATLAAKSEPTLADFLKIVARDSGANDINIVADGLGVPPLLDALVVLKGALPDGVQLNEVVLRAPDMDRSQFADRTAEIKGVARRITLMAAASDRALNISRRYVGLAPRAGDVPEGGPMVLDGVETVDATEPVASLLGPRPASASKTGLLALLSTRAMGGTAGFGALPQAYVKVSTPHGTYWRFQP